MTESSRGEAPAPSAPLSDFDQLMADIEAEAEAEGPEAVARLEAFTLYFAAASRQLGS